MFDVKLLFYRKVYLSQTEKNGCYGHASLFSVIKFKWKNDDLFQTYSKKLLSCHNLCKNISKREIRAKGFVPTALRYFGVEHFDRYCTKIYGKQEKL